MEKADYCSVPAAHRQTLRSVLPGWAARAPLSAGLATILSGALWRKLADERVDVKWMRLDPAHRTSTVVVDLDDHGERSFTFMVRPSADLFLEPADLPTFSAGEWLHVCSIALSAEPSRSATFEAMAAIGGGRLRQLRPQYSPGSLAG
jgi:sugar/nucleoside kinase (ribokinase family)